MLALHREKLRTEPHLRWLFFEITDRCNLSCRHCGSSCTATGQLLTPEDVEKTLISVKNNKDLMGYDPIICLTGGEPMLHPRFFEIAELVKNMGFLWGMTTNATLIDPAAAEKLKAAGLATVSVSLDGTERTHDALRRRDGAWQLALRGIKCLQDVGIEPQVTSVIHPGNIGELDAIYDLLCERGITSWRPINTEPIGRACEADDLLLDPEQLRYLLSYIRSKRFDPRNKMEVTFGCSHYLGTETERMVRDNYFICGAGILVASVRSNGDICACLDIENRPALVQGNIHTDDFADVWLNRFKPFRRDRTADCAMCRDCSERFICAGDSAHTWDYNKNEPLLCMYKLLNK